MTDAALATQDPSQVPALVDPSQQITAEDVLFPRLYLGQSITRAVEEGLVRSGDWFIATGEDDPEPEVVVPRDSDEGLYFHALALRKAIARSDGAGNLERWAFSDPSAPRPSKATGAWTTYTYLLAIPSVNDSIPIRTLFWKSKQPAAQKINTVLSQHEGPPYEKAFRLKADKRTRTKEGGGEVSFYVPVILTADVTDEGLATAKKLSLLAEQANQAEAAAVPDNEPAI